MSIHGLSHGVVRVEEAGAMTSLTLQDVGLVMPGGRVLGEGARRVCRCWGRSARRVCWVLGEVCWVQFEVVFSHFTSFPPQPLLLL